MEKMKKSRWKRSPSMKQTDMYEERSVKKKSSVKS